MSDIKFIEAPCDFCHTKDFQVLFSSKDYFNKIPGTFQVVKCRDCGLVYTNPRPSRESMSFFYPNDTPYFKPNVPKQKSYKQGLKNRLLQEYYGYFPEKAKNLAAKFFLLPFFILTYRKMRISGLPSFVKNGRLLDIGCSYGYFLAERKKQGWTVKGLEPNKEAADWGRINLGLDIVNTLIDDFKTEEKFDVITMRMTMEHVFSPARSLEKIRSWLKPGGVLILIIPDFSGFESKLYKKYAYTLQLPTHLFHFTPATIKRYLHQADFGRVKIYHHAIDRDLLAPLEYMHNDGRAVSLIASFVYHPFIRKTIIKFFVGVLSLAGQTSRMTLYARSLTDQEVGSGLTR